MPRVKPVLQFLLLILVLYTILRGWFWLTYFPNQISFATALKVIYWGLRLDLNAIILINLPLWIYLLFVFPLVRNRKLNMAISLLLFLLINIPFLALNIIDQAYFNFDLRRSTVDILGVFGDAEHAWGIFFSRYWYLVGLFILVVLILWIAGRRIMESAIPHSAVKTKTAGSKKWISVLSLCLLFALLVRGWGVHPLTPATTLLYLPSQYQPVAENSTITFLYSLIRRQTLLEEKKYFSANTLDSLMPIRREFDSAEPFRKKNVIVFVLESFSKGLLEKGSSLKAQTPFLDSIMSKSIVCSNAYANGLESNKGLVALLAGIPPLMDEAYYHSPYSNNPIRGIGTLLKEEGYTTHFFMGASPDHFGFGKLCKLVGIDEYYSEKEYGNPKDHDGTWGIFDHKFLPFAASVLKQKQGPFLSVIFNVSSHHPFTLPVELQKKFTLPGQQPQQNSISYVDYSLRLFFDSIRTTEWYRNSIFVFVADHAVTFDVKPKPVLYTAFQIPFFIHIPGSDSSLQIDKTVQQLDLVPTVFDLLHYHQPFMSFGRSIFDSTDAFVVNKIFGNYQLIDEGFLLGYNEQREQSTYFYNFRSDPDLKNDLINEGGLRPNRDQSERKLKAIIQRFNNSLLKHQLLIQH